MSVPNWRCCKPWRPCQSRPPQSCPPSQRPSPSSILPIVETSVCHRNWLCTCAACNSLHGSARAVRRIDINHKPFSFFTFTYRWCRKQIFPKPALPRASSWRRFSRDSCQWPSAPPWTLAAPSLCQTTNLVHCAAPYTTPLLGWEYTGSILYCLKLVSWSHAAPWSSPWSHPLLKALALLCTQCQSTLVHHGDQVWKLVSFKSYP